MKINLLTAIPLLYICCLCSCGKSASIEMTIDKAVEIKNPILVLKIFGHDASIMDDKASLILETEYTIKQLPIKFNIDIPLNSENKITPLDSPKDIEYYLGIEWDSNGDGHVGAGDISFDYDAQFPVITPGTNQVLKMKLINSD